MPRPIALCLALGLALPWPEASGGRWQVRLQIQRAFLHDAGVALLARALHVALVLVEVPPGIHELVGDLDLHPGLEYQATVRAVLLEAGCRPLTDPDGSGRARFLGGIPLLPTWPTAPGRTPGRGLPAPEPQILPRSEPSEPASATDANPRAKRFVLSPHQDRILATWALANLEYPYPTEGQKAHMGQLTDLNREHRFW